jgi:cyclophilin family peptidyl-prolyl cis-trans isomerase
MLRDFERFSDGLALIKKEFKALGGKTSPFTAALKAEFEQLERDWKIELAYRKQDAARDDLPRVRLKTSRGDIVLELFEDDVPTAVANFVELIEKQFYDGMKFHWSTAATYTDGGDPNSRNDKPHDDGFGGPGYEIETEVGRRQHFAYTVAFIDRARARRAQGSQFRIMLAPSPALDGVQTVFGRIVEGQDVARRLEYYDVLESATVIRKRPHDYKAVRRP